MHEVKRDLPCHKAVQTLATETKHGGYDLNILVATWSYINHPLSSLWVPGALYTQTSAAASFLSHSPWPWTRTE